MHGYFCLQRSPEFNLDYALWLAPTREEVHSTPVRKIKLTVCIVPLGLLVVTVLATKPRFAGSYLAEDDGFFKGDKIRSTTYFGGDVKPSVLCRKILRHVKDPYSMRSDTCRQNSRTFLAKFLSALLLGVSAG
jgi:hypothetical protein